MTPRTPNVLLILCDQFRYDSIGYAGKYEVKTPNIDRLADEGLFFRQAYTPLPVCAPARQAILTGLQPDSIGALFNYNFLNTRGADPAVPTWVSELKGAGYRCGFIGKWDASPNGDETAFGSEPFGALSESDRAVEEKYGFPVYRNGWFGEPSPYAVEDTRTFRICRAAAQFIREANGTPWHLWVDITDPHLPCRPSAPYDAMYRPENMIPWDSFGDTLENKPYIQKKQVENWGLTDLTWSDFAPTVARYFGVISQTDAAIGHLLDALRETGTYDDTLIILTADHGDTCGGHGMLDKHYILYDDVVHVPFIVRHPSLGHQAVDRFASNCLDIAPTVEKLCGLTPESPRHGRPVSDYVTLPEEETPDFAVFTSNGQQFGLFTQRGIRTARYKYIWNLTDIDEFYDLALDPGEKINRIGDGAYTDIRRALGAKLFGELRRRKDPFANSWVRWQIER